MPIKHRPSLLLERLIDSLTMAASFILAAHTAKIHAGLFAAPLLPELHELPLLVLSEIAWHASTRATGLYDPSRSRTIASELINLGKNTLVQFLGLAAVLFFLKTQTFSRFFVLLYSAGLLASALAMRLIGRACVRARRLPMKYLLPATGAVVLVFASLFFIFSPAKPPRPNIILISIDTLRADRLGCYGCPTGTSPNIDAFSRESVQFMQAVSQAPSTATSHMSLFTGLLPPVHRVSSWLRFSDQAKQLNLSSLGAGIPTLAQYLKENGYRTIGLHNGGLVSSFFGFNRGFDYYTKRLIPWDWLYQNPSPLSIIKSYLHQSRKKKKPLFLFLHHYICHAPYIRAPREIRQRFLPNPVPGLPVEWNTTDHAFEHAHDSFWKAINNNNESHRRHVRALYDAGVNYADWVLGEIVTLMKQEGAYDKSLIAIVSDHGEEFWEHGDTNHKHLFVETLHVPLLIKFPDGEYGGKRIEARVGQFDLMPTLLDYLRITPRLKPQAESLLPRIRGEKTTPGRILSFDDSLQFVRFNQGHFTYSSGPRSIAEPWLFDSSKDPREQCNLAPTRTQIVVQMRAFAAKIMNEQQRFRSQTKAGAPDSPKLPEELKKQLKELGYL